MIRTLYILLLFFISLQTAAQKIPPFGENFRDWVNNQARSNSKALCDADYPSRLQNTFVVALEILGSEAYYYDSVLNSIYTHFNRAEPGGPVRDSLRDAVERSHDARFYYFALMNLEGSINQLTALKNELDSLASRRYFINYGLAHVGRENVMQSYMEMGNKFKETFNQRYDNYFSVSVNTTGQTNIQFDDDQTSYYLSVGGMVIGAALCGPPCAAVGGIVGGIIGAVYSWFNKKSKEEEAREEIAHQKRILQQALDVLPEKLLNGEEMFAIYKTNYDTISASFSGQRAKIDSIYRRIGQSWKNLFAWNAERLKVSAAYLTDERIKYVESRYSADPGLRNLFSEGLQRQITTDVEMQMDKLIRMKFILLQPGPFTPAKAALLEDYADELNLLKVVLYNIAQDDQLIPSKSFLESKIAYINTEIASLDQYREGLINPEKRIAPPQAPRGSSLRRTAFLTTESTGEKGEKRFEPMWGVSVCYLNGNYGLCNNNDTWYRNRFMNSGNNPIQNIYGSSYDGGIREFNTQANRDINLMQSNLNERVSKLKSDYNSLRNVQQSWQAANAPVLDRVGGRLDQTVRNSADGSERFFQNNRAPLEAHRQQLQDFVSGNFSQGSNQTLLRSMDLQRQIIQQVPAGEVSPSSVRIAGYSYEARNWSEEPGERRNWEREVMKQRPSMERTETRVNRNFESGTPDPVFRNRQEYESFRNNQMNEQELIRRLSDPTRQLDYSSYGDEEEVIRHYHNNSRTARLYAEGRLPGNPPLFDNYDYLDAAKKGRLNTLVQEYKGCPSGDASTACKSAFAYATYTLTGERYFFNNRNPDNTYFDPVDAYHNVTNSPDWQFAGYGNSQAALNEAALLASTGYTVVAFKGDGINTEMAILHPGLPMGNGTGTGWQGLAQPSVSYFSSSNPGASFYGGPLSQAFSTPEGVAFYAKAPSRVFSNRDVRSMQLQSIGATSHNSDLGTGPVSSPSLRVKLNIREAGGKEREAYANVDLHRNYVESIRETYGQHADQVYKLIYDNRDRVFGNLTDVPPGLSQPELQRFTAMQERIRSFEQAPGFMNNPGNLYLCQSLHCLYSTSVAGLSDPTLDREALLTYNERVSETLMEWAKVGADIGTAFIPYVNDARDWFELTTGVDLISGDKLEPWERVAAGVGLLAGSGAAYRGVVNYLRGAEAAKKTLEVARLGIPGLRPITEGALKGSFVSEGGLVYKGFNPKGLNETQKESRVMHILRRHTDHDGPAISSPFRLAHPFDVFKVADEAWKLKVQNNIPYRIHPTSGNRNYYIDMGRQVGGSPKHTVVVLVTENTDEGVFIRTVYSERKKP